MRQQAFHHAMPQNSEGLRRASWWIGGASVVLPGLFMIYVVTDYMEWAKHPRGELGFMVYLVKAGLAIAGSALLSMLALWLNGLHLQRNRPATPRRYAELALIASPAMLGCLTLLVTLLPAVLLPLFRH